MTQSKGPPPGQGSDPLEMSSSAVDFEPNSPKRPAGQTEVSGAHVVPFPPRIRPPRPRHTPGRRAPVRIVAIDGRFPNHRVFSFELDDYGLDELIAHAERLERGCA